MSEQNRALVVDDSKSARLVLKRMLEKHGLDVDTVESAAQALDFLTDHRPDVIFMDHMMPGMDGFEAVKAIKNNPQTATIPVMMYTSKGGDLYLGQARALGAVGVLPKTVAPAELFDSLQRLGLVEERRTSEHPEAKPNEEHDNNASERAEDIRKRTIRPVQFNEPGMQTHGNTLDTEQLDNHVRHLLEEQRVEMRKDLLLSLETVARQTGSKLNKELDEKLDTLSSADRRFHCPSKLPVLVLGTLLLLSLFWNYTLQDTKQSPNTAITPTDTVESSTEESTSELLAALDERHTQTLDQLEQSWQTAAWAINQTLFYNFDEIALDGERVDLVASLLERLAASGFRGKVTLETQAGEFCLLGDQDQGFHLAPAETPIEQCQLLGNPVQPTDSPAAHQSLQFANFIASSELINSETLSVEIVSLPRSSLDETYPARESAPTAQEWNLAASLNNRINVRIDLNPAP